MLLKTVHVSKLEPDRPTQTAENRPNPVLDQTGYLSPGAAQLDCRSPVSPPLSAKWSPSGESPDRRQPIDVGPGPPPARRAFGRDASGLSAIELDDLQAVQEHEFSANTLKNYRGQWNRFAEWAQAKAVSPLPAAPAQVAAYLAERIERQQHKPATLRVAASAIAFVHRAAGPFDPCSSDEVKRTLRGAGRKLGRGQQQARPLTDTALDQIRSTACMPRLGRGGRPEYPQTARNRGLLDIALISLMRDGTGRLLIRHSKTDAEGAGAILYISPETMAALEQLRSGADSDERLFPLRPNQIAERISQAAAAAGLGAGFSGHSPRVGMAQDLARAGIELTSLMTAGRWRDSAMPALYTRNETAARGAVAQYCVGRRRQLG